MVGQSEVVGMNEYGVNLIASDWSCSGLCPGMLHNYSPMVSFS